MGLTKTIEIDGKQVLFKASAAIPRIYRIKFHKEAGINALHAGSKRIMQNKHYLGDDFYPAIIDKETFIAAGREIKRRSAKLGRNDRFKETPEKKAPTLFRFGDITEYFDNPVKQAEYLYSLIESEVI